MQTKSFTFPVVHLYLLLKYFYFCECTEFDQNYFGVTFRPYIKQAEEGSFETSYTYQNIVSMLTVVSSKFARVFVKDTYAVKEKYISNVTYYTGSYASLYSGEVAATINREKGRKALTVLYEAYILDSTAGTLAEIELVLEATEKANEIFPGTVEGIILGKNFDIYMLDEILLYLKYYKSRASQLQVKLGANLQDCSVLSEDENEDLVSLMKNIINASEVITCGIVLPAHPEKGPEASYRNLSTEILAEKELMTSINPNVTIIGNVEWSSSRVNEWETIDNLQIYWESFSKWAAQEKVTVFLEEAFDNPWRNESDAHLGWWKLTSNAQIDSVEGYVEKFSEYLSKGGKRNKGTSTLLTMRNQYGRTLVISLLVSIICTLNL